MHHSSSSYRSGTPQHQLQSCGGGRGSGRGGGAADQHVWRLQPGCVQRWTAVWVGQLWIPAAGFGHRGHTGEEDQHVVQQAEVEIQVTDAATHRQEYYSWRASHILTCFSVCTGSLYGCSVAQRAAWRLCWVLFPPVSHLSRLSEGLNQAAQLTAVTNQTHKIRCLNVLSHNLKDRPEKSWCHIFNNSKFAHIKGMVLIFCSGAIWGTYPESV